jgi:hypothetical protein
MAIRKGPPEARLIWLNGSICLLSDAPVPGGTASGEQC